MVTDYFLARRRRLHLEDLYPAEPGQGAFQYWRGHNLRAAAATLLGVAVPLPAWLAELTGRGDVLPDFLKLCGHASWFVACAVATLAYLAACAACPPPLGGGAALLKAAADSGVELRRT
mmetsp:Transcript_32831/g.95902  ORF Transcript_32831/g.95902 Transcript_32831/m.95902 type:complete len:119 (+) Transcript_32831:3-359(+)